MSADLYRDANVGLRARLGELVARIREHESEVNDAFWSSLDDDVREPLLAAREALELVQAGKELSFEEMARVEGLLSRGLAELERLIAQLPVVEEEWRALPDDVGDPPAPRESWLVSFPSLEERIELERALTAVVRDRDRQATIDRDGRRSWLARFRDRGAPFSLRATAHTNGNGQIAEVAMALHTSVPRAMPRLVVRHESVVLAFGKALGIKQEVEVGEPSFDGLFLIEATNEVARRLLPLNVRTLLLALARFDVPTLEIDPPRRLASLSWRFEPSPVALDAAIRVLSCLRETTAEVRFRR